MKETPRSARLDHLPDGSPGVVMAVEGGGTHSRGAIASDGLILVRRDGPSVNPESVGLPHATAGLLAICHDLWQDRPNGIDAVDTLCVCLASAPTDSQLSAVVQALAEAVLPGRPRELWVANDVLPIVWHPDAPSAVAVICGTGTSFAARSPNGWARASGLEWILSDEGGGTDLGIRGLRAVVRAADGRGPTTVLTALAAAWHSGDTRELMRFVHGHKYLKPVVASFASYVLAAAAKGDAVAEVLISDSVRELIDGCKAVIARSGIEEETFPIVLSGSLLVEADSLLRLKFLAEVAATYPGAPVSTIRDPIEAVVGLSRRIQIDPHAVASAQHAIPVIHRTLAHRRT